MQDGTDAPQELDVIWAFQHDKDLHALSRRAGHCSYCTCEPRNGSGCRSFRTHGDLDFQWLLWMNRASEADRPAIQGGLVLTRCSSKDFEHVFIIPTTGAAFHGHAVFVRMLLQQRQREAIQPGEVLTEMLVTDT